MRTDRRPAGGVLRFGLVAGGLTWIPARWGVLTTWDTTWLGLGYVGWNRIMLVPLALLAVGCWWAARAGSRRRVRVSWRVVGVGFAAAWLGVLLEFVVGGGLRGGPPELAMAGWSLYLVGTLLSGVGAVVAAVLVGAERAEPRRKAAALALGLAGVSMLAWLALMVAGWPVAALVDQVVAGAAWVVAGLTVRRAADRATA